MSKTKWYIRILRFLRIVSAEVEDGTIGAGKKTANGGKIAGAAIDGVTEVLGEGEENGVSK